MAVFHSIIYLIVTIALTRSTYYDVIRYNPPHNSTKKTWDPTATIPRFEAISLPNILAQHHKTHPDITQSAWDSVAKVRIIFYINK